MHSATLITAADQFHPIDYQPLILPTLRPEHQTHMCSVSFHYSSLLNSLLRIYLPCYPLGYLSLFVYFLMGVSSTMAVCVYKTDASLSNNATQPMPISLHQLAIPESSLHKLSIVTIFATRQLISFAPKTIPKHARLPVRIFINDPEVLTF